jgi:hypothetical protein
MIPIYSKKLNNNFMKTLIVLLVSVFTSQITTAQKYYTKNGHISFFSKSPLENISANNNQVMSVLNTATGDLQFSVLIKGFNFEKSLMQEHFNENYMESDKFPKASFKGMIQDFGSVDFSKDGNYPVNVSGELTMHGVNKKVITPANVVIKGGKISGIAKFMVKLADYNISIPKLVKDNIAETVEITVNCNFDQKM